MLKKPIIYNYNNVMSDCLKSPICIYPEELESYAEKTKKIHSTLVKTRENGGLPFYELPYKKEDVELVKRTVSEIKSEMGEKLENFVVIGIGGSSLGGIALTRALLHPFHNLLPPAKRGAPRIFFVENIDPDQIQGFFDMLDPEKTVINVISKSGSTAETMANFLLFQKYMAEIIGENNFRKQVIATTDPKKGAMRNIAEEMEIRTLPVPEGVGGRFSVLSPVGLFPAAMVGIDIDLVLEGAAFMDRITSKENLFENPAYMNAIIHYHLHTRKNVNVAVLMPYSEALAEISLWYRQLLAESLGKMYAVTGEVVYAGQTPVKAVGAVDQHSQIQLYREGPFDKVITILRVENFKNFLNIPSLHEKFEASAYLGGHTLNELFEAEAKATMLALTKSGRPNIEIVVPEVNPYTVGQIFYMYEVQTIFAGYLYGVNPVDQPGVEAGKHYAYGILGRKGYEKFGEEIENLPPPDPRYMINPKK